VLDSAVRFLVSLGACRVSKGRARHERVAATAVGALLADLPVDLDSGVLLVRGGIAGVLNEAVLLAVLCSTTPGPVDMFIGKSNAHLSRYAASSKPLQSSDRVALYMANFSAVQFYRNSFLVPYLVQQRDKYLHHGCPSLPSLGEPWQSVHGEEAWCDRHFLNMDAIHHILATVKAVMEVLYRSVTCVYVSIVLVCVSMC
jgi:HrpA-like RNA helicase